MKMKLLKEFNQYLSNLAVMNIKLHNLHWNVKGLQFVPAHEFTEMVYNQLFEYYDAVAEHIKMNKQIPLSRMNDYLSNATIQEIEPKNFEVSEALQITLDDLVTLRNEASSLRNASDAEGWFSAVALFEGQIEFYNKQIWFLQSMLV